MIGLKVQHVLFFLKKYLWPYIYGLILLSVKFKNLMNGSSYIIKQFKLELVIFHATFVVIVGQFPL